MLYFLPVDDRFLKKLLMNRSEQKRSEPHRQPTFIVFKSPKPNPNERVTEGSKGQKFFITNRKVDITSSRRIRRSKLPSHRPSEVLLISFVPPDFRASPGGRTIARKPEASEKGTPTKEIPNKEEGSSDGIQTRRPFHVMSPICDRHPQSQPRPSYTRCVRYDGRRSHGHSAESTRQRYAL
jgi:hypothetical protein